MAKRELASKVSVAKPIMMAMRNIREKVTPITMFFIISTVAIQPLYGISNSVARSIVSSNSCNFKLFAVIRSVF